ncbi:hypothetical protein TVAG_424590 [Trichomonas vaginalis G3]|uniref:protein disulfide-isomerase n=1 Tax=Trichomonas vaginalis (strain ATCC PRA-98 / G3) TaxID=412133 RepID=A2E1U8_TRIV3|nr:intramolecular oxidoreductase activity, transposing S-S bonds [Trichomonas vaginalis G3]EAY13427.1 hypothetical protein TVAG_424590 [Trichomonas vaginalis G3]KAI5528201.1 intramolecular oxidoreductase activity, transposing S-S bonds [Trichomonas vaginalis G3]|eukprot:XP_001325650.1 hypothetical protein [Trichomonas vaginalis G3]
MNFLIFGLIGYLYPYFEEPNVDYICDANYTQVLNEHRNSFVFIKSKICSHCKEFYPNFQLLAKQNPHKCKFYIVDYENCKQTVRYFNVSGTPELILPRYGKYAKCINRDIKGPLLECMNEKFTPAGKLIDTYTEFIDLLNANKSFFIANHRLSKEEQREADEFSLDYRFYSIVSWDILHQALPQYKPKANLLYYRAEDRQFLEVSTKIERNLISEFLSKNKNPKYMRYSPEIVNEVFVNGANVVMVKFDKSYEEFTNDDLRILENIGSAGVKTTYFTSITGTVFDDVVQPPSDAPTPVIAVIAVSADPEPKRWIRRTDQIPSEFIKEVISGKIPAYVKSEELPTDNDGPIKRIVGLNYEKEVGNSEKPFVLLIYTSDNYVTSVLMDKLVDAEAEIGNSALFGTVDYSKNAIPLDVKEKTPIVAIIRREKAIYYTKEEKSDLITWIKSNLSNDEL